MRSIRAASAILAILGATACGSESEPPDDTAPSGSLAVMSDWIGCEVFDELAPVQEYTGAVGTDGELLSDGLGEGIDAEAATCSGLLDLATFEDTQGTFDYSATGDAAVRVGLAPWSTDAEAEANFTDRVQTRRENAPGVAYTDERETELSGDWDQSLVIAGETEHRNYIDAFGRVGSWVVYASIDYLHDPGVGAYESAPEFYPDSTAERMAVYPFTPDQFEDWVAVEYLPALQADILQRAESE